MSVATGIGVDINAPGATIVLRGLSIAGVGGATGIELTQGTRLRIENCVVSNLASAGIAQNAPGSEMIVLDTIVRDNVAFITVKHSTFNRNAGDGVLASSVSPAHVVGSVSENDVSVNGADGIHAHGTGVDITVSANTGSDNVGAALHCANATAGMRTAGNNIVDSLQYIGGGFFAASSY